MKGTSWKHNAGRMFEKIQIDNDYKSNFMVPQLQDTMSGMTLVMKNPPLCKRLLDIRVSFYS